MCRQNYCSTRSAEQHPATADRTRASDTTTAEYKRYPDEWKTLALNTASGEGMQQAFQEVGQTRKVSKEEAERLGLFQPDSEDDQLTVDSEGLVEIPLLAPCHHQLPTRC